MSETKNLKDGVSLRVAPEVLVAKAEAILKDVIVLKQALDRIEQKIDGTSSYWNGEAGEQYRQIYNEQREDIRSILNRMNNNPTKLIDMGKEYINTDKEALDIVNELIDNVIV